MKSDLFNTRLLSNVVLNQISTGSDSCCVVGQIKIHVVCLSLSMLTSLNIIIHCLSAVVDRAEHEGRQQRRPEIRRLQNVIDVWEDAAFNTPFHLFAINLRNVTTLLQPQQTIQEGSAGYLMWKMYGPVNDTFCCSAACELVSDITWIIQTKRPDFLTFVI